LWGWAHYLVSAKIQPMAAMNAGNRSPQICELAKTRAAERLQNSHPNLD